MLIYTYFYMYICIANDYSPVCLLRGIIERITFTALSHRLEPSLRETSRAIGCHLNHSYYANFLHLYSKQDTDMDDSMAVKLSSSCL